MSKDKKDLVFISHATPEDNVFTLWLSIRLKLLGYEVWSDVTQLFGGEKWWDDIEQAVDKYTCKFILVITKTSLSKPGVQREVELALAAEEKSEISNFIIPIIIDDSGFGGQPYGLSDRNIIPFSNGWGMAFGRLVEKLSRDGVHRGSTVDDLGSSITQLINPSYELIKQEDIAVSNWLSIESIPEKLSFYRLPVKHSEWSMRFSNCPYPWFEWGGMLVSFAKAETLQKYLPQYISITSEPKLELKAALKKQPHNHVAFLRGEVFKKMNYLLSESWSRHMQSTGLHQYELSSRRQAWFFPDHEGFAGKKEFADVYGVLHKKQVVGYSPKNKVFWHYAIEAKAQYGLHPKFCLIPHVVFSEDGRNPIIDKNKMHRLRRGFCKSWWNERWRDMLLVYLSLITKSEESIKISVDDNEFLVLNSRPEMFISDVTLVGVEHDSVNEEGDKIEVIFND
jgi:hypothetical protein